MKRGEKWGPGVFAFYFGIAGGCAQLVPIYRSIPIMPEDILPSFERFFLGVAIGAALGAAIAWVRNLFS